MTTNNPISAMREALTAAKIGLRDWEVPANRYKALDIINAALDATEQAAIQPAGDDSPDGYLYRVEQSNGQMSEWRNAQRYEWHSWMTSKFYECRPFWLAAPAAQQTKAERAAISFDSTAKCSPLLTMCPRCKNPHNACDQQSATPASKPEASELPFTDLSARLPQGWTGTAHSDGWIFFKRPDDMRATVAPGEPLGSHGDTLHMLMTALIDARQPVAAPSDSVRKFLTDCAGTSGGMVNGNHLARYAKRLLDAAPVAPEQAVSDADILAIASENGIKMRTGQGAIKFARAILAKRSGRTA